MYGDMNGGGPMVHNQMGDAPGPMMMDPGVAENQYENLHNEPQGRPTRMDSPGFVDDGRSVASGTSSLMGGAQSRLKQNRMKKM